MSDLIKQIYSQLLEAIKNDALRLPTLPEVAVQVREVVQDPEIGINELSQVIARDAALTARIIKVVNSPLMRTAAEISDLNMAINRLGISYTANLAFGLAMEQMFQATSDVVDHRMRMVWASSTEIAGISHALCRRFTRLKPDQAMLAGLVHQIGILPILTFAEDHNQLLRDAFTLDKVIEKLHPYVGQRILAAWDFPPAITRIPLEQNDFQRQAEQADLVDIVQVALLYKHADSEHPLGQIDWTDVTAFQRLGVDPAVLREHQDEALNQAIQEAARMLGME